METIDVKSGGYWEGPDVDFRLNPSLAIDSEGLYDAVRKEGIEKTVFLATSGTQGKPKLVALEKDALLASARAVNAYCHIDSSDTWLAALSTFHVGGLAIYARAFLSGSRVIEMDWQKWTRDGKAFLAACQEASLTSLTPVHLYDLVESAISPPDSLRGVFVGGAALSRNLADRAKNLGWPLWTSYGMTEAGSQIATSLHGDLEWLPLLPHWETRLTPAGRLQIRGESLMKGFFSNSGSGLWQWTDAIGEDGYYTTGDVAEIRNRHVKIIGRADDLIKIYGELVSIGGLEDSLCNQLHKTLILFPEPNARTGASLTAVIEASRTVEITEQLESWSRKQAKYIRIERVHFLPELPRTDSGKLDRASIRSLLHALDKKE